MPETKIAREELLEWLDEIKSYMQDEGTWGNSSEDEQAHSQLKALLQQPRKVGREFVERWAILLSGYELAEDLYLDLSRVLKELGELLNINIEVEG